MIAEVEERQELSRFRQQDMAIAELADKYLPLKINGINDKAGFDAVHKARMIVKGKRVDVEKLRKELKADALEYGRQVDAEAKRITAMIEPIESHLEAEENAVLAEKEKIKRAAEEAKARIVEGRVKALHELGAVVNPMVVAEYTEQTYTIAYEAAQKAKAERDRVAEEERQRLAAEAEARRIEAEKLAAERAELDKVRREQEQVAAAQKAEQAKIEAKAAEQRRAIELENAKREAAEKARVETEQRIAAEQARAKQEAIAKESRLKAEEEARIAAAKAAEALRPQREKLLLVASAVDAIEVPEGPGRKEVMGVLNEAVAKITRIAEHLLSRTAADTTGLPF